MSKKILITDSLFMFDKHVKQLEEAGYEVERLDVPKATEEQLVEAVKGKVGYVLGGIEKVTDAVIEAADELEVIVFTGTGFKGYIPGWKKAAEKGIAIGNSPYANVYEVAEWALAATLALQRNLFALGPRGTENFSTVTSLTDLTIGVIGLGRIGQQFADMVSGLGAKEVSYWSREEKSVPYRFTSMNDVFSSSDVVFLAVDDEAGNNFISKKQFDHMKQDALFVSIVHDGIINEDDLFAAVSDGRIRAAVDILKNAERFKDLPMDRWYAPNASSAFNSWSFLNRASDMATETVLNLLKDGKDQYRVN